MASNNEPEMVTEMVKPLHLSSKTGYSKPGGPVWWYNFDLNIKYNSYTYFFLRNENEWVYILKSMRNK